MDGTFEFKSDHDMEYGFSFMPSQDKTFYFLMFYVGAVLVGIIFIACKLRGYNRPEEDFTQTLGRRVPENQREQGHAAFARSEGRRRRNIRTRILENIENDGNDSAEENARKNEDEREENAEKIGAKKLRKLQMKEEKKLARDLMEMERIERRKKVERREETRRLQEQREREMEEQKAEEEKLEKERKEREEHEIYLKLKESFVLNEEGEKEVLGDDYNANLLQDFISYLKEKKVILMEDLASHFGLRTKDAVEKVQSLLSNETITGIIDDRGKFIYISPEELEAFAKYVKQQGRIEISELAKASNRLINLNAA